MSPPTLFNPQTPKIFHPLSFSRYTPRLSSIQTLTFSGKPPSLSPPPLFSSSHQSPYQYQQQQQQQQHQLDDDEEELVVGDCLVFEDGVFEDPYLQEDSNPTSVEPVTKKSATEILPQNLVPDKWRDAVAEINITKKERRKIAHQLEFGSRVERKKRELLSVRNVKLEEFLKYRQTKLAQLKPLVLDNPTFPAKEDKNEDKGVIESREDDANGNARGASSSRVVPKDPRRAVYGGTLEDITKFFNSGYYDPGRGAITEGPRKLFTKEEKVLLNMGRPDLAAATSEKWLPLHSLAASGGLYLMNALLKHNVDINGADKNGLTALHRAIICKKKAITNCLLRESANPFVCDKDGASLMHYAVRTASIQTIKILLLYNVDINIQDNDGWTPLHLAVQTQRTDVVRLLLIKGADKTLKNKDGLTPLDLCFYSGQDIRTYELIKLMKLLPKPR